jgi:hypothetical protein
MGIGDARLLYAAFGAVLPVPVVISAVRWLLTLGVNERHDGDCIADGLAVKGRGRQENPVAGAAACRDSQGFLPVGAEPVSADDLRQSRTSPKATVSARTTATSPAAGVGC